MSSQQYSFFQSVEKSFDKAAKFTKWDLGILEQIKACNSVYRMRFPLKEIMAQLKLLKRIVCNTASINRHVKEVSVLVMK